MTDVEIKITDEPDEKRFVVRENGAEAQLLYRTNGKRLMLVHTEVPESLGGRGIAGRLVAAAVERAAASGETVVPWCPYARKWLKDHPETAARVVIDWSAPPAA